MDEDERAAVRIAPRERRERDAGGRDVVPGPPLGSASWSAAATPGGRSAAVATIAADLPPGVAAALQDADPNGGPRVTTTRRASHSPRSRGAHPATGRSSSSMASPRPRGSGGGSGRRFRRPAGASSRSTCRATARPATGPATTGSATTPPMLPHGSGRRASTCRTSRWSVTAGVAMTAAALPWPASGPRRSSSSTRRPSPSRYSQMAATRPRCRSGPRDSRERGRRGRTPTGRPTTSAPRRRRSTQLDFEAARAVLLDNGDWDGGLADLSDPAADGIPTWLIRGDPAAGGSCRTTACPASRRGRRGPRLHARRARTRRSGRTRPRRPRSSARWARRASRLAAADRDRPPIRRRRSAARIP